MNRLRTFDWVVATRMHFAILALGVGIPVLPIAYEFKTEELFKLLGYDSEVPQIEGLTSESLISAFDKSVENYASDTPMIRSAVASARQQAWQVADLLSESFPEHVQAARPGRQQIASPSRRLGGQVPTTTINE
jgi:colanic acid/amylovoran biosynthesis protein